MKQHNKSMRKVLIYSLLVTGLLSLTAYSIFADAQAELDTVSHLQSHLKLDNTLNFIVRMLGQGIYSIVSFITELVESSFMKLARFNLFDAVTEFKVIEGNIGRAISTVFIITLAGYLLVKMVQGNELGKVSKNAIFVGLSILVFSSFITLADEGRVAFTNFIDSSINNDQTISTRVYLDNTYDLKALVTNAKNGNKSILTLKEQGVDEELIPYISWDERLDKKILGSKYILNEVTNAKEAVPVRDGMWGIGDERYWRYDISYAKINTVLLISAFVYTVALIKASFIVYDITLGRLLGKFGLVKGIGDLSGIAKPYVYYIQSIVSLLILVVLVSLYPVISSAVFAMSDDRLPLIAKLFILASSGLVILYGSDYLNNILGFEGARRTMLTTFMAKKSLDKAMNKAFDGAKKIFGGNDSDDSSDKKTNDESSLSDTKKSEADNHDLNNSNTVDMNNNENKENKFDADNHQDVNDEVNKDNMNKDGNVDVENSPRFDNEMNEKEINSRSSENADNQPNMDDYDKNDLTDRADKADDHSAMTDYDSKTTTDDKADSHSNINRFEAKSGAFEEKFDNSTNYSADSHSNSYKNGDYPSSMDEKLYGKDKVDYINEIFRGDSTVKDINDKWQNKKAKDKGNRTDEED